MLIYIRKVTHVNKKNRKEYYTYKLVESVRTEKGPRQRTLLNLGTDFELAQENLREDEQRVIQGGLIKNQDTQEIEVV